MTAGMQRQMMILILGAPAAPCFLRSCVVMAMLRPCRRGVSHISCRSCTNASAWSVQATVALGCMEHRGACGGDRDRCSRGLPPSLCRLRFCCAPARAAFAACRFCWVALSVGWSAGCPRHGPAAGHRQSTGGGHVSCGRTRVLWPGVSSALRTRVQAGRRQGAGIDRVWRGCAVVTARG